MSEQSDEYDIAIIEGSITRAEDEERLKIIRSRAKILIALGACATIGGINKLKNNFRPERGQQLRLRQGRRDAAPGHRTHQGGRRGGEGGLQDPRLPDRTARSSPTSCGALLMGKKPVDAGLPGLRRVQGARERLPLRIQRDLPGADHRAGCDATCPSGGFRCFGCRG